MGVTPGTIYDDAAIGWTVITPSPGTIVHYVASAANGGNDTNDGLAGTVGGGHGPYLTLQKGMDNLRNVQADWLLLRMGDTWTNETMFPRGSGISATEPWLISSYDPAFPGAYDPAASTLGRPLIRVLDSGDPGFSSSGGAGGGNGGNNTALIGLEFYAYTRDPSNAPFYNPAIVGGSLLGVYLSLKFTWFLIENCKFRFFSQNIGFLGLASDFSSNMTIRRNVIVDCYTVNSNGGDGIHPGATNGIKINENVLDHNGWEATLTDFNQYKFNHQIYVSQYAGDEYDPAGMIDGIELQGNVLARDASELQLRTAGTIKNNLFLYNPDCTNCALSKNAVIQDNVVLHGAKNPGFDANQGLSCGVAGKYDFGTPIISNNIVAHSTRDSVTSFGFNIANPQTGTFSNNIVYDWVAPLLDNPKGGIINLNAPTGSNSGATAFPTFTGFIDDGTTNTFTVTAATVIEGATYTHNGLTFTVPRGAGIVAGTTLVANQALLPLSSGTLTKATDVVTFTITAANATAGATYTNNGQTFTVFSSIAAGTSLITTTGAGSPTAFGTLTKTAGTGDATITFSSNTHSDNSVTFSSFVRTAGRILTVTAITGTPLALGQQVTGAGIPAACYNIGGAPNFGTGTGGTGTYQLIVNDVQVNDHGQAGVRLLIAPETMSIANWVLPLSYVTSGTGSGAVGFIKVVGGVVTSVEINPPHAPNMAAFGVDYLVGDSLTAAVPGTSGFAVTVASVRTLTSSGNQLDAAGANNNPGGLAPAEPFPIPSRSLLTYDHDVLGGPNPGTFAHYIGLARLQSKQNWNPLLTANAVANYVRVGFGIGSGGGGSSAIDSRRYQYVAFNG